MKLRFNSFDIVCGVTELQSLVGLRVNQIYDIDNKTYLIRLQGGGESKKMLLIESGIRFHTTAFEWPKNMAPSGFSMKLRKHLKNKRLEKLEQLGVDRIVDFQFGVGEAAYHIIVELYDRGNIILTDHEMTILYILRPHHEGEDIRFAVREKYPSDRAKEEVPLPNETHLRNIISTSAPGDNLKRVIMPLVDCGPSVIDHVLTNHKLDACVIAASPNTDDGLVSLLMTEKEGQTKSKKNKKRDQSKQTNIRSFEIENDIKPLMQALQIIITAMDRFVWFVLLVVMSHLVTEFTRVTGFTRGPRQDVVMVNDSLIQPIKVQNLVLYPGQEYGHYEQQNQQYYNGNNRYNNYANNNNNLNSFFSSLFNTNANTNNNNNHNDNNNGQQQQQQQISGNIIGQNEQQGDVRTFSFRPIIDSIFEIPITTLRAVNNLVGRLTGSYQQQQPPQQQQPDQQPQQLMPQQQSPPQYPSYTNYGRSGGGMQKSAGTLQPKTEFEMLNRIRQTGQTQSQTQQQKQEQHQQQQQRVARAATNVASLRKASMSGFQTIPSSSPSTTSMKNTYKSWQRQQTI